MSLSILEAITLLRQEDLNMALHIPGFNHNSQVDNKDKLLHKWLDNLASLLSVA